ncbi:Hypothetical predicted protein [Podarcis lilfordi]|uniref:Uncharacterized protein n=1 Tax=Podarcis lilfordi TaxID=74358 RepID=A0AA35NZD1_9SAUR|nr:Hypothetical predicted protein [Podarcis lilfordi]
MRMRSCLEPARRTFHGLLLFQFIFAFEGKLIRRPAQLTAPSNWKSPEAGLPRKRSLRMRSGAQSFGSDERLCAFPPSPPAETGSSSRLSSLRRSCVVQVWLF